MTAYADALARARHTCPTDGKLHADCARCAEIAQRKGKGKRKRKEAKA